MAKGIDLEPVTTKIIAKSIACCKNFTGKAALTSEESVQHWLGELAAEMSERLEKDLKENNRKAKQIIVSFCQEVNKKDVNSSRTHPLVSYNAQKIAQAAFEVVKKFCRKPDGTYLLKFLGLNASNFDDIKKVREITSFFQVGAKTNGEKSSTEGNVFDLPTQELDEDASNLVFYDDSCRVEDHDEDTDMQGNSSNTESNEIPDEDVEFQKNKENSVNFNEKPTCSQYKRTSSFFVKFFDRGQEPVAEKVEPIEHEQPSEESNDSEIVIEEPCEVCNECKKSIPISELTSHQDYHFALSLSKNENSPRNTTLKTPPTPTKNTDSDKKKRTRKRKGADSGGTPLTTFFKKQDDPQGPSEICPECNKKIPVDEVTSHLDYHIAKKIHLELNPVNSVVKPVVKKVTKTKSSKAKNQATNNKSVISFFKPLG